MKKQLFLFLIVLIIFKCAIAKDINFMQIGAENIHLNVLVKDKNGKVIFSKNNLKNNDKIPMDQADSLILAIRDQNRNRLLAVNLEPVQPLIENVEKIMLSDEQNNYALDFMGEYVTYSAFRIPQK